MADTNISQTQHITSLDFDITKALQQLGQLQERFNSITQEIASRNWSIKAVIEGTDGFDKMEEKIRQLSEEIESLNEKILKFQQNGLPSPSNNPSSGAQGSAQELKQLEAELKQLESVYEKSSGTMSALQAKSQKYNEIVDAQKKIVAELSEKLKSAENEYGETSSEVARLKLELTNAQTALQNMRNSASDAAKAVREYGKESEEVSENSKKAQKSTEDYKKSLDDTKKSTKDLTDTTSTLVSTIEGKLVSALEQAVKAGYDAIKSTEDSMVEISRVLDLTSSQTDNMKQSLFELGNEYGRSFEDVSDVALRFAQAGYDMNDTLTNTSALLLGMNTAELEASSGTTELIGIMSQWGMQANELVGIIDKLNYTADNNAVTTQDLADGLLKASSMAKTAGISFNDTIGLLTAMKEASGAAGKEVGNALKSILAYIQRPESLDIFESMGIDVFKDKVTGELLPMMDILSSMAEKWNSSQEQMLDVLVESGDAAQMMSEEWAAAAGVLDEFSDYQEAVAEATDKANDAESRAQATAAAGVYRRNYYIALMEHFSEAMEISKDLVNAEGHSMQENSRYMETLTAKTEQLVVALTELASAAADAGLLDFAKGVLETATAITKCAAESNSIKPILVGIVGLLIKIKSQNIAAEFKAIGGSFKNMVNLINTLRGVETAAKGAAAATMSLNSAIGLIGIGLTVVSAIIADIRRIEYEAEVARQKTIDDAAKEKERADSLKDTIKQYEELSEKYDELNSKTSRSKEENEELESVTQQLQSAQDKLTESYGQQAEAIDFLNGKREEQIAELDKLNDKELQSLRNKQNAAVNASKAQNSQQDAVTVEGALMSADDEQFVNLIKNGLTSDSDGIVRSLGLLEEKSGKANLKVEATAESLERLNLILKRIEETEGGKNSQYWTIVYEAIVGVEGELEKTKQLYADLAETQLDLYNNSFDEKGNSLNIENIGRENYLSWREGLLASAEGDKELESALAELITKKFPEQDYLADLDATKNMTTAEKAYYFAKKNSTEVTEKSIEATNASTAAVEEAEEMLGLTDEKLKELAKTISDSESNIVSLNKYMETLAAGNGFTAEQVLELCESYGLLAEQFTLTENGYTIEISALKELQETQKQTAITARLEQAGYTEDVINSILKRIQAYSDEVKGISSVAEAQVALGKLKLQLSEADANAHVNSQYDYENHREKTAELRGLVEETEEYASTLENLDKLQNELYDNLGKSFDKASSGTGAAKSSASEADNAFKALIETIERFGDMGVYSAQEVIDKFEELRRTSSYTEEQIKEIEDKLHELYSAQVEGQLKAAEQGYKDYVQKTKDKYDDDKEKLKELLEDEMDMFKEQQSDELDARKEYWDDEIEKLKGNLNAQIDASQKAYETKKKLATKSYDNQISALESLRDAEIGNIEASYNAQIAALEKIKAARKAQRDEEDYQDERAELLEQISYWEQRTGTEAVENLESLKKQLADLDKEHQRDLEDKDIDNQISNLEEQRDNDTAAIKQAYGNQIAALKASKETELEIYESTYNAEQELLKAKLEKDIKAMEDARDADLKAFKKKQKQDLKLLEEEQEKKLKDLEDEKDAAIKAADEKWAAIEQIFTDANIAMVASAGIFAEDLYKQFNTLFTQGFKMDLEKLRTLMSRLNAEKSAMESKSGIRPTTSYSGGSSSSNNISSSNSSQSSSSRSKGLPTNPNSGSSSSSSKGSSTRNKKLPVQANTGGMTTADGLVMLHKNELIINPPTTKKLEDLLERFSMPKSEIIIDPRIMRSINKMADYYHSPRGNSYNTNNNSYNNSYDNSRPIVQNFNAPLQNIEKVEDAADLEAATNALERKIMREISTKI